MAKTGTKTVALGTATSLLTWGIQQLTQGHTTTGGLGITLGFALLAGYQISEEAAHREAYNTVVDAIGEDTLRKLAELGGDELDERLSRDAKE